MISALVGVLVASSVSVYLVLAIYLTENKRKASSTDFPELEGLVTKGYKKAARSSSAGCSPISIHPEGVLQRPQSLRSLNDRREELPLSSKDCTDLTSYKVSKISLCKAHSWPPSDSSSMPAAPTRPSARISHACSHSGGPAAIKVAVTDTAQGLALQTRYKQHYDVVSDTAPKKEALLTMGLSLHCFLEQATSPAAPLDAANSPNPSLEVSSFSGLNPRSQRSHAHAAASLEEQPARQAALESESVVDCTRSGAVSPQATHPPLVSAFAAAASCPPTFFDNDDKDDMQQPLDGQRQGKSFEPILDILLDLSVASLLTSSSAIDQLSLQQHQAPQMSKALIQARLAACVQI